MMMMRTKHVHRLPCSSAALARVRGFTLVELLVAMTIIVIIAVLTIVSIRSVFLQARMSSGMNAVTASLGQARALAMKSGRPVLVAFYPQRIGPSEQRISVVFAQWEGDSRVEDVNYGGAFGTQQQIFDRFRPVSGIAPRSLPRGISIGGPYFLGGLDATGNQGDDMWLVPTNLLRPDEAPGRVIGVMFDTNGSMITEVAESDADHVWIDFNNDGVQNRAVTGTGLDDWYLLYPPPTDMPEAIEVNITFVPYFAVFNERDARERYDDNTWTDSDTRLMELSEYILDFADRLHFNRYTGVAM